MFSKKSPDAVFLHLKELGLDGFELLLPSFLEIKDEDLLAIKKLSQKYHLPVLSVHQTLRFLSTTRLNEIEQFFSIAAKLQAKVIVLHISSAGRQIFNNKYVHELHQLEKKYKIKAAFENNEKYVASYLHPHRWHEAKFSDIVNKNDFHITFDIVHLAHSGGDILQFYQKNKFRIMNVHLSDYRYHLLNASLRPMRYKHMPLGDGELPIEDFVSLLHREAYNGLLTLELHSGLDGVEQSMGMIKRYRK
jgi:sugar phosphate isomerase/epimerase